MPIGDPQPSPQRSVTSLADHSILLTEQDISPQPPAEGFTFTGLEYLYLPAGYGSVLQVKNPPSRCSCGRTLPSSWYSSCLSCSSRQGAFDTMSALVEIATDLGLTGEELLEAVRVRWQVHAGDRELARRQDRKAFTASLGGDPGVDHDATHSSRMRERQLDRIREILRLRRAD